MRGSTDAMTSRAWEYALLMRESVMDHSLERLGACANTDVRDAHTLQETKESHMRTATSGRCSPRRCSSPPPSSSRPARRSPAVGGGRRRPLAVTGGARMYPAYAPATSRYAVHAGAGRIGAGGGHRRAEVWFDGVPDPDGTATFTDVVPGEEISVFVGSGSSRRALALYVLPSGFPTLASESTGAPLEPGNLALTLDDLTNGANPRFEAVVDRNGVPVYTRRQSVRALDLKLAANGHFTVHRPTTTPGRTGGALVELDDRFQELRRFETTGLVDTDDHDSRLMPDGSRWLIAYEPNAATGLVDSVIQHVGADGDLLWQWTSAPYAGETMLPGNADYAHINSIDVQPDGDVLASFRNLSSVFLIRPGAGGGAGEVVWKLGGRDSDFAFPALPDGSADGGPCAQHSASILPNGNVLVFDNGSSTFFGPPLCVDPQDPLQGSGRAPVDPRRRARPLRRDRHPGAHLRRHATASPGSWARQPGCPGRRADRLVVGSRLHRDRDRRAGSHRLAPRGHPRARRRRHVPKPYITYRVALVPARDGFDPEVVARRARGRRHRRPGRRRAARLLVHRPGRVDAPDVRRSRRPTARHRGSGAHAWTVIGPRRLRTYDDAHPDVHRARRPVALRTDRRPGADARPCHPRPRAPVHRGTLDRGRHAPTAAAQDLRARVPPRSRAAGPPCASRNAGGEPRTVPAPRALPLRRARPPDPLDVQTASVRTRALARRRAGAPPARAGRVAAPPVGSGRPAARRAARPADRCRLPGACATVRACCPHPPDVTWTHRVRPQARPRASVSHRSASHGTRFRVVERVSTP